MDLGEIKINNLEQLQSRGHLGIKKFELYIYTSLEKQLCYPKHFFVLIRALQVYQNNFQKITNFFW
jgi:plasmid rolling circle replication initiator protein Rep